MDDFMSDVGSIILNHVIWIDPDSMWHGQQVSIAIHEGIVTQIETTTIRQEGILTIDGQGYHAGPGWCDIGTSTRLPSDETHESVQTLSCQALRGGYTHLGLLSYQEEPIDDRGRLYDLAHHADALVNLHPIPAATMGLSGTRLTEILELISSGAHVFSDGFYGSSNPTYHRLAMEYIAQTEAKYLYLPTMFYGVGHGQVHESTASAQMGLPGIPSQDEAMAIVQAEQWSAYTGCSIVHHLVSSADSVTRLRGQKTNRHDATVSAMNLLHHDEDVLTFDENLKVLPPLRGEEDRLSLILGLREGYITAIASNHTPISFEYKARSFGYSPFGASTIGSTFSTVCTAIPDITPLEIHQWMSHGPRHILGQASSPLDIGCCADLVVYNPYQHKLHQPWSGRLANNTPFPAGHPMRGHVLATVSDKSLYLSNKTN